MKIDCVRFYVDDAQKWRDWFARAMQFRHVAGGRNRHSQIEVVRCGAIAFVLSSPLTGEGSVAEFLRVRPPGVADVTFLVADLDRIMKGAIARGAKILQPIACQHFPQGRLRWSKIEGSASLSHTLVERLGITPFLPEQDFDAVNLPPPADSLFSEIDHLVLNVAVGELEKTVSWYEEILGFERRQTFAIQTERSGLYSQVLVHPESGVQMPVNEPTSANSQIQEFLDFNGGSGVQHIALKTKNIISTICQLQKAGLSFLEVPPNYYVQQQQQYGNLNLAPREWEALERSQILIEGQPVDGDSAPVLLQIFTQPIFGQPTFFFEFIERRDRAQGFGEGNFRALFEAIEKEQAKRGQFSAD
ncbi:MAG: 4-hydroxyphenylpyruvate dioxygenase [Cyanobacteriota bacterium]|nr:4-hydroxyphenylpyruvate dioxygenase [Cyanobacteriota bacterium]